MMFRFVSIELTVSGYVSASVRMNFHFYLSLSRGGLALKFQRKLFLILILASEECIRMKTR